MNDKITDNEDLLQDEVLDALFDESRERSELLADINSNVMNEIHTANRKAWWLKWGRVIVFSFGLPWVLGSFAYIFSLMMQAGAADQGRLIAIGVSSIFVLGVAVKAVENFSFKQV